MYTSGMDDCVFCSLLKEDSAVVFYRDPKDLFVAIWTSMPVFPGHALVMPKRHITNFRAMNETEMARIATVVAEVKTQIEQTDLKQVCENLAVLSDKSKVLIDQALEFLKTHEQPPDAFNDGINDGEAAGQTIPHLHWHILPRWKHDNGGGIVQRLTTKSDTL